MTGVAASLTTFWNYVDGLVHQDARQDALTLARHRAFIAPRLIGSCVVLAAFPLYVALRGTPTMLEAALFAWMVVPLALVYFLSRTGRYEAAHVLSAVTLTGLIAFLIWYSGAWSIAACLLIVPLELALAGSRHLKGEAANYRLLAAEHAGRHLASCAKRRGDFHLARGGKAVHRGTRRIDGARPV